MARRGLQRSLDFAVERDKIDAVELDLVAAMPGRFRQSRSLLPQELAGRDRGAVPLMHPMQWLRRSFIAGLCSGMTEVSMPSPPQPCTMVESRSARSLERYFAAGSWAKVTPAHAPIMIRPLAIARQRVICLSHISGLLLIRLPISAQQSLSSLQPTPRASLLWQLWCRVNDPTADFDLHVHQIARHGRQIGLHPESRPLRHVNLAIGMLISSKANSQAEALQQLVSYFRVDSLASAPVRHTSVAEPVR